MLLQRLVRVGFIIWILLFSLGANASGIDPKMRSEDSRLERPVTFHERRIYLGELFGKLRTQTGIAIDINEKSPLSGVQVTLHCTSTPVVQVLNSLWSLLSNREAPWSWSRISQLEGYRYEFTQTGRGREKADRFSEYAQKAFEEYVAVMLKFAKMTPAERKRNIAELSRAMLQNDDTEAQTQISEERVWEFVRLFAEGVPPDLQIQILRTQREANIPLQDLPQSVRDLFHKVYTDFHFEHYENGVKIPLTEPTTLHIFSSNRDPSDHEIVPGIMIDYGKSGSISCIPNHDIIKGVRAYLKRIWMLPGDVADDFASRKIVPEEEKVDPATILPFTLGPDPRGRPRRVSIPHALDTWLLLLARDTSIPMIEILPFKQTDPGTPVKGTVQEFLHRAEQNDPDPMYKWRDGMLLVNYPMWFVEEENMVPYAIIKQLALKPDEAIPLPRMATLMTTLSEGQVRGLGNEYRAIGAAALFYPAFRFALQSPELMTSEGIKLTPEKIARLLPLPLSHPQSLKEGTATALRLTEKVNHFAGGGGFLETRWEGQVGNEWVLLGGYTQSLK